jgi:ribonuclease-3 family protein
MINTVELTEKQVNINEISTPALAYLGDCVIELLVRRHLVLSGIGTAKNLNKKALEYVCAPAQAEAVKNILDILTDEEEAYFRRGRNIGHTNTPKSATVAEYRSATGMETLFGYLHLTGQNERAEELFIKAYALEK